MQRSSVVDSVSGGSVVDQIRTSSGTFLAPNQDDVLAAIQMRVAELSMLPQENQEALQVLHYGLSEKYGAHMDTFFDARHIGEENGGQRAATALMFLNEPEEGGETVFPNVAATNDGPGWSPCAREALAHKPKTGDLILFWSLTPTGEIDPGTTHTACPVIRGEKWSAPLWIRQARLTCCGGCVCGAMTRIRPTGAVPAELAQGCHLAQRAAGGGRLVRGPAPRVRRLGSVRRVQAQRSLHGGRARPVPQGVQGLPVPDAHSVTRKCVACDECK